MSPLTSIIYNYKMYLVALSMMHSTARLTMCNWSLLSEVLGRYKWNVGFQKFYDTQMSRDNQVSHVRCDSFAESISRFVNLLFFREKYRDFFSYNKFAKMWKNLRNLRHFLLYDFKVKHDVKTLNKKMCFWFKEKKCR